MCNVLFLCVISKLEKLRDHKVVPVYFLKLFFKLIGEKYLYAIDEKKLIVIIFKKSILGGPCV